MTSNSEQPNTDSFHLVEGGNEAVCGVQAEAGPALPVTPRLSNKSGVCFRKKPVVIEAVRINACDFNGHDFDGCPFDAMPQWLEDALRSGVVSIHRSNTDYAMWQIKTLEDGPNGEAKHIAGPGDWIIRGVQGELYFCKPDIFNATYEAAS